MTWTEGTIQLTDTIIINGGYWGLISFGALLLVCLGILFLWGIGGYMMVKTIQETNEK
jgi:hypothetical protein